MVIWLTGLSGAGKSSIGRELHAVLNRRGHKTVLLDGDEARAIFGGDLGFSVEERRRGAMRLAQICRWLHDEGIGVICATIGFFPEVRRWNRDNIRDYFEVYVKVPLETLMERDSKAIYSRALAGELSDVVGVDLKLPPPDNPDLVIDNTTKRNTLGEVAERIADAAMDSKAR